MILFGLKVKQLIGVKNIFLNRKEVIMATFKTILQDLINGAGKVNREQFLRDALIEISNKLY